jgi:ketosteroid isomerase-like protein
MKKLTAILLPPLLSLAVYSQSPDPGDGQAIRKIMAAQVASWNRGNLEEFMIGYWENDSLVFVGKSGLSYGYSTALKHYKETYPDSEKMGTLFFTLIKLQPLSGEYYYVTGKWFLKRKVGDIGGYFTLLFRKFDGQWKIIEDHTS